jgi:hypothetical protein
MNEPIDIPSCVCCGGASDLIYDWKRPELHQGQKSVDICQECFADGAFEKWGEKQMLIDIQNGAKVP